MQGIKLWYDQENDVRSAGSMGLRMVKSGLLKEKKEICVSLTIVRERLDVYFFLLIIV